MARHGGSPDPSSHVALAALDGGSVVGTVQIVRATSENGGHRAEIQRLAVRADCRGTGLGRALLDAAAGRARELGLHVLWLTTHAGTGSDRFYESVGWSRLGVLPLYSARPDGTLADGAFYYLEL